MIGGAGVVNDAGMAVPTVLVIEDERAMRRFLWEALHDAGFKVHEAFTLAHAEQQLAREMPALILLDLGLPDGDGMDLLQRLRERSRVPVIVLSGRGDESAKVAALDSGADDYLTKPFGVAELLARIRVALRHAGEKRPDDRTILRAGPVVIDRERREVRVDGTLVTLTPIEFDLLSQLAANAGRVLTHRQLLDAVWGPAAQEESHYVRVHISALRRKIEREPGRPRWLVAEQGVGYRLRED